MKREEKSHWLNRQPQKEPGWAGAVFAAILMTAGMMAAFVYFSDNIHDKVMDKEIQNLEVVSGYLTKIIRLEMENCVDILTASEETLCVSDDPLTEQMQETLKRIEEKTDFNAMGIVDLEGQSINDEGAPVGLADPELMKKIKDDEPYISDILTSGEREMGQILVAVPLHNNGRIVGAVWGQYPVSVITEKVEMTGESDTYFQIIDSDGNYISRSGNRHAFMENMQLWEELEYYELCDGITIDGIQKNVERHEADSFYFRYQGNGRYVTYEPLGINNWYVFSVLVEDSVNTYVNSIKEQSVILMTVFSGFAAILFGVIGVTGHKGVQMIKKQNQQLAVKSKLFRMILSKTRDVPFEIDIKKKRLKIYHHDFDADSQEECEIVENFSISNMIKSGRIREKDVEQYRKMYQESIVTGEMKPYIFKVKVNGVWEWDKIHLLRVDSERMVGFLENYEEQIAQNKQIEEMDYKTKHDTLTGVYNRGAFIEEVESRLTGTYVHGQKTDALFLLDLDNFKELNDSLGHLAGDQALEDVAAKLKAAKRPEDVIGRIGGDEFMLFMKGASGPDEVREYAEKLNKMLIKTYHGKENAVTMSVSIGIAVIRDETTFSELYKKADEALYKVKADQRNGYWLD